MLVLLLMGLGLAHDKPFFSDGGTPLNVEPDDSAVISMSSGENALEIISEGPARADTLSLVGRGERRMRGATTDVWVHEGFAFIGTFNNPCGDGTVSNAGVRVYDIANPATPIEIAALPSVEGSRVNDVKVATLNSGPVLVHSNEQCANGPGGFEIYSVANPLEPIHLAHMTTNSANTFLTRNPDHRDEGVHNLFLFSQGERDYVAAQVYTIIGSFQIFDITNPTNPQFVSSFGAERVRWPDVDWQLETDRTLLEEAETYIRSGFGTSTNRFLHDHYVTPDGQTAYLANWDAGLIRLDLSDIYNPTLVSVALEPTSEDGEVNSHSVWPSANGKIVVEGEEDFSPYSPLFRIMSGANIGPYPSAEGSVTQRISSLPSENLSGQVVYLGDACNLIPDAATSDAIALVLRGRCTFETKATLVKNAGYAGIVVFNHAEGGDQILSMGGVKANIPGVFVGHSTGLNLMNVESSAHLEEGALGEMMSVTVEPSGWSGLRIWDYSDPANPILASTFNTLCSAHPDDASCEENGLYSSHNVIVEDNLAYVSWYREGVLVIDISDPYNPAEVARFKGADPVFTRENGGIQEVWGIYKVPNEPFIYASDRNGGLYVLALSDSLFITSEVPSGR